MVLKKQDFHMHTPDSRCVYEEYTIHEMLEKLEENGVKDFAITDHYYSDKTTVKQIKDNKKEHKGIKFGLEIDYCDFDNIDKNIIESCDIVVGSIHKLPNLIFDKYQNEEDSRKYVESYFDILKKMMKIECIDIIGHPFDLLLKYDLKFEEEKIIDVLELAKENGKKIEFNELRFRRIGEEKMLPFYRNLAKLCKKVGCDVSLGSDAHKLENVGDIRNVYKIIFGVMKDESSVNVAR